MSTEPSSPKHESTNPTWNSTSNPFPSKIRQLYHPPPPQPDDALRARNPILNTKHTYVISNTPPSLHSQPQKANAHMHSSHASPLARLPCPNRHGIIPVYFQPRQDCEPRTMLWHDKKPPARPRPTSYGPSSAGQPLAHLCGQPSPPGAFARPDRRVPSPPTHMAISINSSPPSADPHPCAGCVHTTL